MQMRTRNFEEFLSIQRLPWAGLFLETNDFTLAVDPLANAPDASDTAPKIKHWGVCENIAADAVLITHTRPDPYDMEVIRKILKPGGVIVCAKASEAKIGEDGVETHGLEEYQPVSLGPFDVAALPA